MKFAKRRDANEKLIVDALVAYGCSVTRLNEHGVPDLLVGLRGKTWLIEVKMPLGARGGLPERREHEGGKGDMTAAQVKWWAAWKGEPAVVVRNADEALMAIGARL